MPGGRSVAILEQILEQALASAQQAEVYYVESRETPAHFEANHLKLLETSETRGVALRIIKEGRIGFASTTNLEDIPGLIRRAVEIASFGTEARFDFPKQGRYPNVKVYDPEVDRFSVDNMVALGQSLIDAIRLDHPNVLCGGIVSKSVATVAIVNSSGLNISYTQSGCDVFLEGTVVQDTDMLFVFDEISSCQPIKDTRQILSNIGLQLDLADTIAPPVSGTLPVLFTPHAVAEALVGPLVSAFNGKSVLLGTSPLGGRLGERITDERFSLWDDPTVPDIPGSSMTDDEGVPSRRTPLIEHGVAKSFLYDLQTAGQAGAASTGSASRTLSSLPSPSPSVLIVGSGGVSYDAMVKDIKDGIIVEGLLGAGQGNTLAGDFNANVLLGYRVTNGKIVGRVKDVVVSGNVYQVLNNLEGIGDAPRWLGGRIHTPALYCASVSVASNE